MIVLVDMSNLAPWAREEVSRAVQKHGFDMGQKWGRTSTQFLHVDAPYLGYCNDGTVSYGGDNTDIGNRAYFVVTPAEFLKMKSLTDLPKRGGNMDTGYKVDLSWIKGACRKVVSEAIQKKAFELGYKWCTGSGAQLTDKPYLFFKRDKYITQTDDADWFNRAPEKEVSVNNWLGGKLPEEKTKYTPKDGDPVLIRMELERPWGSGVSKGYLVDGKYAMYDGYYYKHCIPFNKTLFGTKDTK